MATFTLVSSGSVLFSWPNHIPLIKNKDSFSGVAPQYFVQGRAKLLDEAHRSTRHEVE